MVCGSNSAPACTLKFSMNRIPAGSDDVMHLGNRTLGIPNMFQHSEGKGDIKMRIRVGEAAYIHGAAGVDFVGIHE